MSDAAVEKTSEAKIRALEDTDIEGIVALDEKVSGHYRPDVWEQRVTYYFRRDPEASAVAEADGRVVGFMLAEVRAFRGQEIGRRMTDQIIENFRARGVQKVRTLVHGEMEPIAKFFGSVGFEPEPITAFVRHL